MFPGHELLVRWLKTFKPALTRGLPPPFQKVIVDAQRRDEQSGPWPAGAPSQRGTCGRSSRPRQHLPCIEPLYDAMHLLVEVDLRGQETRLSRFSFLLTAAWLLMDLDNEEARRNTPVMSFIEKEFGPRWGVHRGVRVWGPEISTALTPRTIGSGGPT